MKPVIPALPSALTREKAAPPGSAGDSRPVRISAGGKPRAKAGRARGRRPQPSAGARGKGRRLPAKSRRLGARAAGAAAGRSAVRDTRAAGKQAAAASRAWARWWNGRSRSGPGKAYLQQARSFMLGYAKASGLPVGRKLPLPTERSVAAVVHAASGHPSISAVLEQLGRLALSMK